MLTQYPQKFTQPPQLSAWLPTASTGKLGRAAQLALLAITIFAQGIVAMNVANALFLGYVGSAQLPICFVLLGLFGIAAFAVVSQIVDRFSRPRLFQYALIAGIVLVLGIRAFLRVDVAPVYFCLSIFAFFQFDLHGNILFPNLLSAYLTTLEYKRYVPLIGIAQAIGILCGGGLTSILLTWFSTPDLLFCVAGLYLLCIVQLAILEATQRSFENAPVQTELGLWETLKTLPDLTARYPLAGYLAGSSILFILIYILSEFLWFSTYAQSFTGDALTNFLGSIRVVTSLTQLFALYCLTRPLLKLLGVGTMNLAYPIASFGSFLGIALTGNLTSAIALNINGDSLNKGINAPIHQLFYNAIPPEFSSRVRVLSDGVFYALGLTLAGGLLWLAHTILSLAQIAGVGLGLSAILFLLRWPMSGLYVSGLEGLIRSDGLNLDEFNETPAQLPAESSTAIRELLADSDRYAQLKGLELATALGQSSLFLADVTQLLQTQDTDLRQRILQLLCTNPDSETLKQCDRWLQSSDRFAREVALEVCIVADRAISESQLRSFLAGDCQILQVLATLAAERQGITATNYQIRTACNRIWERCGTQIDEEAAQALIRVAACAGDRDLMPWLAAVLEIGSAAVKRSGLAALATLSRPGDLEVAEMVVSDLEHPDPLARVEAFRILGITRCKGMLRYIGNGLCDTDARVCQAAAAALTAFGEQGLSLAQDCLSSSNPDMVRMAIAAIGQTRTKRSNNILYDYLVPELQPVASTSRWQQQLPASDANWQMLAIAIDDYHQRLIEKVLYVLACMGYADTVQTVNQILSTTDARNLANAVEVLASLPHRRFILPLLPVLEQLGNSNTRSPRVRSTPQWLRTAGYKLLLEALESRERWIRIGASIALATVPSSLMHDRDPLVRKVTRQIFQPIYQSPSLESTLMNRILLLKKIALFKHLSLDELLLIDKALVQEQVLAEETIFTEGSWGTHLFIIAEGQVQVVKEIGGERRELKQLGIGQYFGEIALFDDAPNPEEVIALQDCVLLKLEKSRFMSLITQRPQIILEICRFLSQRIRETDTFHSTQRLLAPETRSLGASLPTITKDSANVSEIGSD